MKRYIIVLLGILGISFMLIGCGRSDKNYSPSSSDDDSVYVYKDSETGCEYLVYAKGYRGGITTRLDSNGQAKCRK